MDQGRRNVPKSLSMTFWNANGLSVKIEELKLFASSYSLDVILVSETKLRDHKRDPKIPGYQIYRRDRPSDHVAASPYT
jgi:exonuclease III